jgi:hypothetical protein
MPDHFCLYGPPFTLSGELYFSDTVVNFSVDVSNPADEQNILAYEWYLDDVLVIDERGAGFAGKVYCGGHKIGVRVLSSEGWSGIKSHSFYTCKAPIAIIIQGPDLINEGDSGTYLVLQQFSDNTVEDLTDKYTFTVNGGASFNGNVLTTVKNDNSFSDEILTITATPITGNPITKEVTVKNTTQFNSAVLVVDLFDDVNLNVIGLIDNPEVAVNHQSVYMGNNFLPAAVLAENAFILASDLIATSSTSWRFEFNLAKLISQYPNTADFVFYIKGRGASDKGLNGAFSLKTKEAKMIMTGNAGNYVPSVTGGSTVGYSSFSSYSVAGANGSYNETDLFTIIRFNYNVPTDTLTYTIPPRSYVSDQISEQVQRNNCGAGFVGSAVTYTLAAGAFTSTVGQADANAQARSFYDSNKQQYANGNGSCTASGSVCEAPTNVQMEDLGVELRPKFEFISLGTTSITPSLWNINLQLDLWFVDGKVYVANLNGGYGTNEPSPSSDATYQITNVLDINHRPSSNISLIIYSFVKDSTIINIRLNLFSNGDASVVFENSRFIGYPYSQELRYVISSNNQVYIFDKNIGMVNTQKLKVSYQGTGLHLVSASGNTTFNFASIETTSSPVILYINPDTGIRASVVKVCSTPPDYSDLSESVIIVL